MGISRRNEQRTLHISSLPLLVRPEVVERRMCCRRQYFHYRRIYSPQRIETVRRGLGRGFLVGEVRRGRRWRLAALAFLLPGHRRGCFLFRFLRFSFSLFPLADRGALLLAERNRGNAARRLRRRQAGFGR